MIFDDLKEGNEINHEKMGATTTGVTPNLDIEFQSSKRADQHDLGSNLCKRDRIIVKRSDYLAAARRSLAASQLTK